MIKNKAIYLRISEKDRKLLKKDARKEDRSASNLLLWSWKQWRRSKRKRRKKGKYGKVSLKGKSKGFTLLELLIVLATLAILIGASIPLYKDFRPRARDAHRIKTMEAIRAGLQQHYAQKFSG